MSESWQPEYQAATNAKPTLTIIGIMRGAVLARAEWTGNQVQLSDKTLTALKAIGMEVIDEPSNYLFSGPVL